MSGSFLWKLLESECTFLLFSIKASSDLAFCRVAEKQPHQPNMFWQTDTGSVSKVTSWRTTCTTGSRLFIFLPSPIWILVIHSPCLWESVHTNSKTERKKINGKIQPHSPFADWYKRHAQFFYIFYLGRGRLHSLWFYPFLLLSTLLHSLVYRIRSTAVCLGTMNFIALIC